MTNSKTLKVPIWDGVDTEDIIGQRIFDSMPEEISLKGMLTDEFDDSIIDDNCWSVKTSGAGSVSETTRLDINGTAAADASAVVFKLNPPDLRSRAGEYRISFRLNTALTDAFVFGLFQKSGEPVPGSWNSPQTGHSGPHAYRRSSDGKIVFRYIDISDVLVYLDSSFSLSVGTTYLLIFESSGPAWRFVLKNTDQTVTHVTTGWVNWSECYNDLEPDWIYMGDMLTPSNYIDLSIYQIIFQTAYPADFTSPGESWQGFPVGAVVDMSTIRVPEKMNPGDAGSVLYQYAKNGGSLNGTWLTQAQLREEADITVTDTGQSIKIVPRYISDGTQKTTSQAYALVDVQLPYAAYQLPVEVCETGNMEVIEP